MYQKSFFILKVSESELCNYGWRLASENPTTAVRFVRGHKMRKVDDLFDEIAAACQFPYYFGGNWPAFAECLGDLDWINSTQFVLVITEFEKLLADEAHDLPAFGRALKSAIATYNKERRNPADQASLFKLLINLKSDSEQMKSPIFDEIGSPLVLQI